MYGFSPRNVRLSNFVEDYLNVRIQQVQYVLENSCWCVRQTRKLACADQQRIEAAEKEAFV